MIKGPRSPRDREFHDGATVWRGSGNAGNACGDILGIDWPKQGAYFFSRVAQHGKRRAEEMREAANTVHEAGFTPTLTASVADKHDWIAKLARDGVFDGIGNDAPWQDYADRLLKLKPATSG